MNDIIKLLNLEDPDVIISSVNVQDGCKEITLERKPSPKNCPYCKTPMHSKGIRKRPVNHPMMQDGFSLRLILKQRRWKCINSACSHEENEHFAFISPGRRSTNLTDILILESFKDLNLSAASIAHKFHVSDTYVLKVFDRFVNMKRLPLGEILSVDEVHLKIPGECEYALVLFDFASRQPIDMIPSRRQSVTEPYFASIPIEERKQVRYLICDMYNPYLSFADKYFPYAQTVVDSFHVVQFLEQQIMNLLLSMQKKYRTRDEALKQQKEKDAGRSLRLPQSDEYYLLKKHKWVMLTNVENINYNAPSRWDRHFRYYMDTYAYEEHFFQMDSSLRKIRDLKEKYIRFNANCAGDERKAASELDALIAEYKSCGFSLFDDFARLLQKHRSAIIRSFSIVDTKVGKVRPSNGPTESLNRRPKDMKRNAHGYSNFEHIRNRILFALRVEAPILSKPREEKEFRKVTGKVRGPYKKNNK